ncbi:MAG TPA: Gfo/Idh/MocA family oxidoreductase [Verrucomicrobiae bacterium]|nr:Gfo/Idh/MocA family oxidoreductase [Verrucomicrobiae bacterium]
MKPQKQSNDTQLSRRQFMGGAAISTAAFMVLPGAVLGLQGAQSANERLNIAGIGFGGQGTHDLSQVDTENIVALCDVDKRYAAHTFKKYPKAKQFTDYRQMLDEMKEIDAVVVATPDHHHAFASVAAIKHGKHVYCEKPLTHSVWEARQVAQAAHAAKVATQMGNQGQASRETRHLCELVWSGVIGPVHHAHIWTDRPSNGLFNEYWPQGVNRPKDTPPVPATLDWDLWLGPAPLRPYHPVYLPFVWRGWWDFGTGALGDIGCHAMDPVFRALKLGAPTSVQAASTRVNEETFPLGSMVTYEFPARSAAVQENNWHVKGLSGAAAGGIAMPACKLSWYDGGLRPPRPDGLPEGTKMGDNGRLLVGEKGFILNNSVFPESCAQEAAHVPETIPPSPGHHKEWIEACKGGKPAGSNFDWAGPLAESVLLGNVALRVQLREELTLYRLFWDSANLKVANLDDANKFVRREYREGWSL